MNRNCNDVQSQYHKLIMIGGCLKLSAVAAVLTTSSFKGLAVTKTGVGTYLITLEDAYQALVFPSLVVSDNGALDLIVEINSVNVAAKTINLVTKIANVVADVTEALDIYIGLNLSNSSVDN